MKAKNIILGVVAVTAIVGFADIGPWYLNAPARPISAIFFILWFIINLLEDEMAKYDSENKKAIKAPAPARVADFPLHTGKKLAA